MSSSHSTTKAGLWDAIVRSARFKEEGDVTRRKAEELVEFVGLGDDMNEIAKNLPYGKQKRLRSPGLPIPSCCCWTNLWRA